MKYIIFITSFIFFKFINSQTIMFIDYEEKYIYKNDIKNKIYGLESDAIITYKDLIFKYYEGYLTLEYLVFKIENEKTFYAKEKNTDEIILIEMEFPFIIFYNLNDKKELVIKKYRVYKIKN